MSPVWEFKTSPYPPLMTYNCMSGENSWIGYEVFLTHTSLGVLKHIPGVPAAYAEDEREDLVLYVRGVPFNITNNALKDMFMPFGRVNNTPILICLGSHETFRWVVMKHADDAQDAKRALHGSTHESGSQLFISMALPAGEVFELQGGLLPGGVFLSRENLARNNNNNVVGHAHPSPPTFHIPRPLLPAIPRIAVPLIAHPDVRGVAPARAQGIPGRLAAQPPIGAPRQQASIALQVQQPKTTDAKPSSSSSSSGETKVKAVSINASTSAVSSSWANIASSSDPKTRVIELNPSHKSHKVGPRLKRVGRIPSIVSQSPGEPLEEQMRLVFLLNLPNNIGLEEITSAVKEGPLAKIQFGHDDDTQARYVGIIFQWAEHANSFYNALVKERENSRPEKFRFIVDAVKGDPFPMDDTIRSMNECPWATRRLTIVKGGFFFMFGERQLRELCLKVAGQDNLQKVWLYNGGNATVVFADVESAIKVKNVLDKRASDSTTDAESEVWKGLQTTFSKDPCVHQVDYKTAMQ